MAWTGCPLPPSTSLLRDVFCLTFLVDTSLEVAVETSPDELKADEVGTWAHKTATVVATVSRSVPPTAEATPRPAEAGACGGASRRS